MHPKTLRNKNPELKKGIDTNIYIYILRVALDYGGQLYFYYIYIYIYIISNS